MRHVSRTHRVALDWMFDRITMRPETNSNDFWFLELISRFEFDFCRCGIFF